MRRSRDPPDTSFCRLDFNSLFLCHGIQTLSLICSKVERITYFYYSKSCRNACRLYFGRPRNVLRKLKTGVECFLVSLLNLSYTAVPHPLVGSAVCVHKESILGLGELLERRTKCSRCWQWSRTNVLRQGCKNCWCYCVSFCERGWRCVLFLCNSGKRCWVVIGWIHFSVLFLFRLGWETTFVRGLTYHRTYLLTLFPYYLVRTFHCR